MTAAVYVGQHRDSEWCARPEVLCLGEVLQRLDKATLVQLAQRREEPARRHYQPCPDCNDSGYAPKKHGGGQWFVDCPNGCERREFSKLPVVGMSSSLTTGGGKGGLVDRLGSVSQSTTPQAQQ